MHRPAAAAPAGQTALRSALCMLSTTTVTRITRNCTPKIRRLYVCDRRLCWGGAVTLFGTLDAMRGASAVRLTAVRLMQTNSVHFRRLMPMLALTYARRDCERDVHVP